ncbi:MAG: aldo/keto reductase [Pseudomonadota bacterium]|nr:aldo/keto reductase [Pseudomonadota bacterium]
MEFRQLGHTDIKVSSICLGTMTWGEQNTEAEGHEQMDYAVDMGINFFDTAEMYAVPPKPDTQGSTEEIIGTWFKKTGKRDEIILATKVSGRASFDWLRDDGSKTQHSPEQIMEAIDKSLGRLQTDYVDLYQLHWPDRPMAVFGGGFGYKHLSDQINRIEDILGVLADIQKAGKVRHFGLSNETPWGIMKFLQHAALNKDLPRIVSVQNAYNLVNRIYELGSSEIYHHEGVGLLAYSPLAQGYLTGKYQNGALPQGSRKQLFDRLQRYETPGADTAISAYLGIAEKWGLDASQLANQFVTTRDFVTSNIIGATTMEQLKLAVTSVDIEMSDELLGEIEAVHMRAPNVCP